MTMSGFWISMALLHILRGTSCSEPCLGRSLLYIIYEVLAYEPLSELLATGTAMN